MSGTSENVIQHTIRWPTRNDKEFFENCLVVRIEERSIFSLAFEPDSIFAYYAFYGAMMSRAPNTRQMSALDLWHMPLRPHIITFSIQYIDVQNDANWAFCWYPSAGAANDALKLVLQLRRSLSACPCNVKAKFMICNDRTSGSPPLGCTPCLRANLAVNGAVRSSSYTATILNRFVFNELHRHFYGFLKENELGLKTESWPNGIRSLWKIIPI